MSDNAGRESLPPIEIRGGTLARAAAVDGHQWVAVRSADGGVYWFPPEYAHLAPPGASWERLEALLRQALLERAGASAQPPERSSSNHRRLRGPVPGETDVVTAQRRGLIPLLEQWHEKWKSRSHSATVQRLLVEKKIELPGGGSDDSRVNALVRVWRKPNKPVVPSQPGTDDQA